MGAARAADGNVVHVVGRMTEEIFSFLGPATAVLAADGRAQVVVMINEPRYRNHLAGLDGAAVVILMPCIRNPIVQWAAMLRACRDVLSQGSIKTLHLHGLLPCLVGMLACGPWGKTTTIIFSPHGSRSVRLLHPLDRLVRPILRPILCRTRHAVIVNVPQEARHFGKWKSSSLVESPVRDAFFRTPRHEACHPLVVTGGRDQCSRNAKLFAQLAVLLSGHGLHIGFNWIGAVDASTLARLGAAGIGVVDTDNDAACASRMAEGWIYLATGRTRGFPLYLVEAMAMGLPCVAFDCPQHREVIVDGETGYLCKSHRDMVVHIAALLDEPELRLRIGQAARAAVARRFAQSGFAEKLLSAYRIVPDRSPVRDYAVHDAILE